MRHIPLGAACVRCPQCDGDGYYEIGDVDYGTHIAAAARTCPICTNGDDWYPRGFGYLELPLTPEHANRIYESGNAAAMELVHDASTDPVHLLIGNDWATACGADSQADGGADIDRARVTCPACYVAVEVDHELAA